MSTPWWGRGVVYQIYPRSFQDSNGDGIGDLPGIISRLDYIAHLGVDIVWLSPFYPSPMHDFGYDISNFTDVDPVFGTLEDFDRLCAGLHARNIRVVLDFVPNHTSDRHPWFVESRSCRDSAKRDWYVWHDPAPGGGPPNNWLSRFGGSGWTLDPGTKQYFYHAFLEEQPDLNWRNPAVREAMADVLRFWLDRGVDGFRVDASAVLAEDELLRDDPPNPDFSDETPPPERYTRVFTDDRPESKTYLADLREVIDRQGDRLLLGEVQGATDRIAEFYGRDRPLFHLPLNFCLLDTPWDAASMGAAIDKYLNVLPDGACPDWILGGHDKRRIASRIGSRQARIAAMLLFTLPGAAIFYAGDELGRQDVAIPPERIRDPFEKLVPGFELNRDPERAPMPWDTSANAGFTTGEPWLPMGDDVRECNVATQRADRRSMLALYRRLIELRRSEPLLQSGRHLPLTNRHDLLGLRWCGAAEQIVILLNFRDRPRTLKLDGSGSILLSTQLTRTDEPVESGLRLAADEGVIVRLRGNEPPLPPDFCDD
jgi:alpha-glucosidase